MTGDDCRGVINAIPVYVWSALPDGTVDFVNPRWENYTGLPSSAAFGWNWQQVVHDEDVERFKSAWQRSLGSLEPLEEEIRVRGKNGAYRWWLIRCTPAHDDEGVLLKWYGAGFDVDDRKSAEGELRYQEELHRRRTEQELRDTIDAIPVLCGIFSADGSVEYFNLTTLEYYGLTAEQLNASNWQDIVHPDDLPRLIAARLESVRVGRPLDIEFRCRRADGEYRWLIHRKVPRYDENGRIVKWYGISFDIEDRKRAEKALLEQRIAERTRIARELHDTLLQDFQATLLMFGAVANILEAGPIRDRLDQALEKADRALSDSREAIQGLRRGVDETEDLVTALRTLGGDCAAVSGHNGTSAFRVAISGPALCLRTPIRHEVFGIASEAIRNAFQHARADNIQVQLNHSAEEFTLAIIDDGIGIDSSVLIEGRGEGHFGLAGMRERARIVNGELISWSEVGSGTRIELKIPSEHAYGVS